MMADSDDDYESHRRHGSQSGRNKFRKERDDLDDSSSLNNNSNNKLTSSSSMSSRESGSGALGSTFSSKHRYASARRPDRSFSSPSRNERSSPPPLPRRSNGYQQQHHYGSSGGHYNSASSNRYDYGAFNSNNNNNRSHDENGFKRSRSSYESSYSNNSYNSNNNYDNSFYDSTSSNKKLRRDWSVLEGASSHHNSKYYEHDNRTDLDDLSDELAPHEYTRLNRPSNYSSYSESYSHSNNAAPNYYNNNYANMQQPHHHHHHHNHHPPHHHHHQPNQMMMGYRNQFGNNFSNNIPPAAYMQPMYPAMQQPAPFLNPMLTNFNTDYDGQTQPQMLSFKQFMTGLQAENNDMSISQEAAMKRYNDYKNAFRREQISLFYAAHKNEDWFRCRYHPDDSARRKDEQRESIRRRLKIFLALVDKYCKKEEENEQDTFDLSLDATSEQDRQNLYKFIDAVIIKLEDGSDEDLSILEEIYSKSSVETTAKTASLDNADAGETSKSTSEVDQIKVEESMNVEKHKVSDDESGMGSNDNSDDEEEEEEEEEEEGETNKSSADSKFDRKKKSKRAKKTKNEPDAAKTEQEEDENKLNEEENQNDLSQEKKEETVVSNNAKLETTSSKVSPSVSTAEKSNKPTIPHKTQSIFFKHLPVNVTRQDLEEIGRKFAGFKRAAISEPAPERRFQRRGWISYDSSVDIKEICTKINGLKLHDMLLNATINREIDQKVKCIIGLTNDKAIVRNDLKLIAKVVDNMDRRWGLWQYSDLYSNNKLNDDDFKLTYDRKKAKESSKKKSTEPADAKVSESKSESSVQDENTDSKLSDSTSEQASETPVKEEPQPVVEQQSAENKPVLPRNPFVEEANEYLNYLSELKEENRGDDADLKDQLVKSPPQNNKKTDEEDSTMTETQANGEPLENSESLNEKTTPKTEETTKTKTLPVSLNKTFKLEKDLKAVRLLDRLILYLRIVHSIDYYNVTEYQQEDWMPNRCGIIHGRGSSETSKSSIGNSNVVNILNGIHINYFDANALKKVQIDEWLRLFEASIKSYVDYRERIDLEIARRLGLKDLPVEIEKFITSNCQKVEKDIWLCPLSGKKFKGPDYVRKHIETKHRERLLELRRDVEYFNRFVLDPKRPYLPEHPLTKNASMMSSQTPGGGGAQMGMPYSDYYRPNMYPGMPANVPFNQYPQSPYQPFNSQKILSNQFSPYPMYNQPTQYSSHKPRR